MNRMKYRSINSVLNTGILWSSVLIMTGNTRTLNLIFRNAKNLCFSASYMISAKEFLYWRTLLTPALYTYAIGMAIFCQFMVIFWAHRRHCDNWYQIGFRPTNLFSARFGTEFHSGENEPIFWKKILLNHIKIVKCKFFQFNFAAGYGMAFMSYVQFYYICNAGENIEVRLQM